MSIIGIDFGTTNSLAAYVDEYGKAKIITDHQGDNLTPSVVAKYDNKLYVGKEARENIIVFMDGYGIKEIKREFGTGKILEFAGERMQPYEIAAIILKKIKRNAELLLSEEVSAAVISVPAEFGDAQRNEIIAAGKCAGFDVKKIINEPTAAILSYAIGYPMHKTILCYDFGGGTFDISVARIDGQDIRIISSGGNRDLGGKDIDDILVQHFRKDVELQRGCTLNKYGLYKLRLSVEELKIHLSSQSNATISISDLGTAGGKPVSYFRKVSRQEIECLIELKINESIDLVRKVLSDSAIQPRDIDEVLLVGGTSRIPMVSVKLKAIFGEKVSFGTIDPQESVALGAGIEAGNLSNRRIGPRVKEDICPFTLGLKKTDKDGNSDVFEPLLRRNFKYGEEASSEFHTILDNQVSMKLEIYQGENSIASRNEPVGIFDIMNIPERPRGLEKVKVFFKYDMNGILNVKARIVSTGEMATTTVKYGFDIQAAQKSTKKIDRLFISDEVIEDAIAMRKALRKTGKTKEKQAVDEAIKYENEKELEALMDDLLS